MEWWTAVSATFVGTAFAGASGALIYFIRGWIQRRKIYFVLERETESSWSLKWMRKGPIHHPKGWIYRGQNSLDLDNFFSLLTVAPIEDLRPYDRLKIGWTEPQQRFASVLIIPDKNHYEIPAEPITK